MKYWTLLTFALLLFSAANAHSCEKASDEDEAQSAEETVDEREPPEGFVFPDYAPADPEPATDENPETERF